MKDMWDPYRGEREKSSSDGYDEDEYESLETDKCSEDMQEIIEKRLHPFHERKIGLQNVGTRAALASSMPYGSNESMFNKEDDIIKIFIPKKFRNNSKIIDDNDYLSWFKENNDLLRGKHLSFRDITLNRIKLLEILTTDEEEIETKVGLYLNLGLNPYLEFDNYYISEINQSDLKSPIMVLKPYDIDEKKVVDTIAVGKYTINVDELKTYVTHQGKIDFSVRRDWKEHAIPICERSSAHIARFLVRNSQTYGKEEEGQVEECKDKEAWIKNLREVSWRQLPKNKAYLNTWRDRKITKIKKNKYKMKVIEKISEFFLPWYTRGSWESTEKRAIRRDTSKRLLELSILANIERMAALTSGNEDLGSVFDELETFGVDVSSGNIAIILKKVSEQLDAYRSAPEFQWEQLDVIENSEPEQEGNRKRRLKELRSILRTFPRWLPNIPKTRLMPELLAEEMEWFVNKKKNYELLIDYKYVDFNAARNNEEAARLRKEEIGFENYKNSLLDRLTILSATSLCNDNNEFIYDGTTGNRGREIIDNSNLGRSMSIPRLEDMFKYMSRDNQRHKLPDNILSTRNIKNTGKWGGESKITLILEKYVLIVQNYLKTGNDSKLRKYLDENDFFNRAYEEETLYQELNNDSIFKLLEDGLENYSKDIVNNDDFELEMPDIYTLLGFHIFPTKFKRELWKGKDDWDANDDKYYKFILVAFDFLECNSWYYIYGLCCFFAQIVGPSYYVYNYYLIDNNEYCPNVSDKITKLFALAYYLVLYARMNSFWSSLSNTAWQYGNTTILSSPNYIRAAIAINALCLYIIPVFTYTLFIELSSITDLILNCLTGEFLINIDNLIVEFIGDPSFIKAISRDLMKLAFIERGYPEKNILEAPSIDFWLLCVATVLQMFFTLMITGFVYKCL
tara:strand:+ start:1333 stop:4056 length:2724 start_codon:yes stop_codon:yes gene_type:complete